VAVALLALSANAHAANEVAPGQLKKQESATTEAPAQAPAATAPAPSSAPRAETKASVPVNKGTVKKAVQKKLGTAPSTTQVTTTTAKRTTRRRSSTRPSSSRPHAAQARQARKRTRAHSPQPVRARSVESRPKTDVDPAPAVTATEAARPRVRRATRSAGQLWVAAERRDAADEAPLTELSRAADRVVEVIPGALILALAGLSGLVLVLILRSWVMERRRGMALVESYGVTVEALATAIEAKDHCTGGHIERVRKLGVLLARTAQCTVVFVDVADPAPARRGVPVEVAIPPDSPLNREWLVVCDAADLPACLVAVERPGGHTGPMARTFEAVWSVDPQVVRDASRIAAALADELRPGWRDAVDLPPQPDPPGASEDLYRATLLFDRMVAYIDAAR
jgi:hypothetical protein